MVFCLLGLLGETETPPYVCPKFFRILLLSKYSGTYILITLIQYNLANNRGLFEASHMGWIQISYYSY